ncbi:hypothetical protein [Leucobacter aridicollis]|uniref:Uncharacterized protein n=1 Tax=Leucobacter aridicollis TaxID=283878 RepID=A0A852RH84_9MICO|nr:hypothetical protein [Leucobacter aridicollis]MBL3682619.1 hypothetical protein [Leucobacter aridicollis]NYD26042.1 hypothetical protein [Leucobacter aridicollis]
MRIRSIKPEFWRSQDISRLIIEDRLLFIGLWSYVDDNGVGEDRVPMIAADLFADDIQRDPSETFARVSRGLARLFEGGQIVRFSNDGRDYFEILEWKKHQRIDKPGKSRLPHHDAEGSTIATLSRDTRENLAPGTGNREQGSGNEGAGDQGGASAAPSAPSHFCKRHPNGTDAPCRGCKVAWIEYEKWASDGGPVQHEHNWFLDGTCLGCDERREDTT